LNGINAIFIMLILPLIGSFVGFILGKYNEKYRDVFNVFMTGIVFFIVTMIFPEIFKNEVKVFVPYIMGIGLKLKLDVFRYIFVWLTSLIWFLVTIYSTQYLESYKNRNRYYLFFMLTLWSTLGIFISENFLNLFTFFEIMSLTSYPLIIHDEDKYSHEAGETYIIMAVAGGLVLLMGIFLLYDYTQTLDIEKLGTAINGIGNIKYVIAALIIGGFGVKAGMVPLHIWLPKAHPAAPAPASAILSGILLKTGIFGILITSQIIMQSDMKISITILILGFITMFLGGFLAIFQRNIKRILAYSSMSQMGYILVAIGLMGILKGHKTLALYGALYHIISHVLFKVLLFMAAGAIYMVLHELSINSIGGFGINKKLLKVMFFIGMCGIIAMPGFNGFISKNLIHHALAEAMVIYPTFWFKIGEIIFIISSGFTTAYLLKLFVAVFIEKGSYSKQQEKMKLNERALIPMVVLSILVVVTGVMPSMVIKILNKAIIPFGGYRGITNDFYTMHNIKSSFISILIGIAIYTGFVRRVLKKGEGANWWYENIALGWFSLEKNFYTPIILFVFRFSSSVLRVCDEGLLNTVYYTNFLFRKIGNMKVNFVNSIESSFKAKIINEKSPIRNVNEEINRAGYKMNSITYSIYIFGIILFLLLIYLI